MARRYEIDLLTATILIRRGVTAPEAVRFFLHDDLRILHNPFLMPSMAEAVERINAAVDSGEKILIFGDRDVDGITSTVLLFEALQEMGADVQWMLPEGEEAYGLSKGAVERAAASGVGLLVTVDCGISNSLEIESAAALGIETVVIDHHNPPSRSSARSRGRGPQAPGLSRSGTSAGARSRPRWNGRCVSHGRRFSVFRSAC